RRDDDPGIAIVDPTPNTPATASPTQTADPSNPHRQQPPMRPPRVPSWGAFRRRPQCARIGHHWPASETLHRTGPSTLHRLGYPDRAAARRARAGISDDP